MKHFYSSAAILALCTSASLAQTKPQQTVPSASQTTVNNRRAADLPEYGAQIKPDERLIIVMAALDAAGFNPTANSAFHQNLHRDTADLNLDLRRRMQEFFARANKNLQTATATDQAARYVSLAYALSPVPELAEPARSTDLPAGLLEVLDFAPLVREFYRTSGIAAKLPEYVKTYQNYGDSLRPNVAKALSDIANYLNTRPQLIAFERITTTNRDTNVKNNKKATLQTTQTRESERRFFIVPDLLAAPNSTKFRQIGDDYFAIVGGAVEPENSIEFRRAFLQFMVDALIYKNAKEISLHREGIRNLLENRIKAGANVSPDPFLAVARSLVAAAEIRERKNKQVARLQTAIANKQIVDKTEATVVNNRLTFPRIEADAFAELSEAYEAGAVLAFFFDEQLRGLESSGFDIASAFADMITSLDVSKEQARLTNDAAKRKTAIAEFVERRRNAAKQTIEDSSTVKIRNDALVVELNQIEDLLKAKEFETAENQLKNMLVKHPGEPRILFAMGRAASLSAQGAFDENLRNERLRKAATHYFNLLQIANPDTTTPALLSNTHVALARIYEFYADEDAAYKDAAVKQFDAAVALGDVSGGSYKEAIAGRARLTGR